MSETATSSTSSDSSSSATAAEISPTKPSPQPVQPKQADTAEIPPKQPFDYRATNTQGHGVEDRNQMRSHAASYSPNPTAAKTDQTRPAIRTGNEAALQNLIKSDARVLAKGVTPDHKIALKLKKHAHTRADIERRYASSQVQVQNSPRCPADSGVDHTIDLFMALFKGYKQGRARHAAKEAHTHEIAMDIIHHMDKEGESAFYMNLLKETSKKHHEQYLLEHPRDTNGAPQKNEQRQADQAQAPSPTSTAQPNADPAKSQTSETTKAPDQADLARKVEQSPVVQPSGLKDASQQGNATQEKLTLEKPFLEPWPHNQFLIDKAAADPKSLSNEELASAYTSARGQEMLFQRLEGDMRQAAGRTLTGQVKGATIADAAGNQISLSGADTAKMQSAGSKAADFQKQLKERNIDVKDFDRMAHERVHKGGISIPQVDAESYLKQAKAIGDKAETIRLEAEKRTSLGQGKALQRSTITPPGPATSNASPHRVQNKPAVPSSRGTQGAADFLQSRMKPRSAGLGKSGGTGK